MADLNKIIDDLSSLTVVEAAELSKQLEEKWGVTAAAAVAAAPAAAGGAAPAEEKDEFTIMLTAAGDKKINVIKELDFGNANLVVAIPDPWIDVQTIADLEEIAFEFRDKKKKRIRVATKYPNLTRDFLFSKGVTQFKLVDSLGATEAYPFTGSAELITDITSTGETLKANNLRILKDGEILKSQACIFTSKKNSKKKGLKNFVKLLSK